jgi:hypothetical protein
MKINLLDLPVLYVNLDKDTGKRVSVTNTLNKLGFKNVIRVPGELHDNSRIGCALGHLKALFTVKPPFIVLEDDVVDKEFKLEINIPDDADGLYLGTSTYSWDGLVWKTTGPTSLKINDFDDIHRVYDMLACHAILYITQEYVNQTIKDIYKSVLVPEPHDLAVATSQRKYNVYSVGHPMFYQGNSTTNLGSAIETSHILGE